MSMMTLGAQAYAPTVVRPALSSVQMTAIRPGDIGTTKPLGIYDPLNLMTTMPDKYRRWQVCSAAGRALMQLIIYFRLNESSASASACQRSIFSHTSPAVHGVCLRRRWRSSTAASRWRRARTSS